ncbi:MAG: sulfite exporter TauE/SafE family protein [Jatrophihabitans sp.]
MSLDLAVVAGGCAVGFVVGITGMGGGALMTPMLVFFFNVNPLTAVSSDLVASLFMKPVGGFVHLRHGTVHRDLVKYLSLGSVPAAFLGVLLLKLLGRIGPGVNSVVTVGLGVALLLAVATMLLKGLFEVRRHAAAVREGTSRKDRADRFAARPALTIAIGALGGLVVGMTSVGSGSLIIVALLLAYPMLNARELVGTDLVQAVPLVASAALGHVLFGHVAFGLTVSLIVGAVPGAFIGARVSSRAPQMVVRRMIAVVLLASGLKLLGVPTGVTASALVGSLLLGPLAWMVIRRMNGLPGRWRTERRQAHTGALS